MKNTQNYIDNSKMTITCVCGSVLQKVNSQHLKTNEHQKWVDLYGEECAICYEKKLGFVSCALCKQKQCCKCAAYMTKCPFCRNEISEQREQQSQEQNISDILQNMLLHYLR